MGSIFSDIVHTSIHGAAGKPRLRVQLAPQPDGGVVDALRDGVLVAGGELAVLHEKPSVYHRMRTHPALEAEDHVSVRVRVGKRRKGSVVEYRDIRQRTGPQDADGPGDIPALQDQATDDQQGDQQKEGQGIKDFQDGQCISLLRLNQDQMGVRTAGPVDLGISRPGEPKIPGRLPGTPAGASGRDVPPLCAGPVWYSGGADKGVPGGAV